MRRSKAVQTSRKVENVTWCSNAWIGACMIASNAIAVRKVIKASRPAGLQACAMILGDPACEGPQPHLYKLTWGVRDDTYNHFFRRTHANVCSCKQLVLKIQSHVLFHLKIIIITSWLSQGQKQSLHLFSQANNDESHYHEFLLFCVQILITSCLNITQWVNVRFRLSLQRAAAVFEICVIYVCLSFALMWN